MIADLHSNVLGYQRWGQKAARLNEVARLGLATVPPALCIAGPAVGKLATREAIQRWLTVLHPARVVLRASSAAEDSPLTAMAGRSPTVLNCPPDADAVDRVLVGELLPRAKELDAGSSVLIQCQVEAIAGGVAFGSSRHIVADETTGRTVRQLEVGR